MLSEPISSAGQPWEHVKSVLHTEALKYSGFTNKTLPKTYAEAIELKDEY